MPISAQRFSVRQLLIAVAVIAVGTAAMRELWLSCTPEMGNGSLEYAAKWKAAFETLGNPETARSRYPEVIAKRFDNGEWVFGVCRDSHGDREGGTIVVKDSTGKIRAFVGHVCGPGVLEDALSVSDSLSNFYRDAWWKRFRFTEHTFGDNRGTSVRTGPVPKQ